MCSHVRNGRRYRVAGVTIPELHAASCLHPCRAPHGPQANGATAPPRVSFHPSPEGGSGLLRTPLLKVPQQGALIREKSCPSRLSQAPGLPGPGRAGNMKGMKAQPFFPEFSGEGEADRQPDMAPASEAPC